MIKYLTPLISTGAYSHGWLQYASGVEVVVEVVVDVEVGGDDVVEVEDVVVVGVVLLVVVVDVWGVVVVVVEVCEGVGEDDVVVDGVVVVPPPVHPLTKTKPTKSNATSKLTLFFMNIPPWSPQRRKADL